MTFVSGSLLGGETAAFYELMSAPASKISCHSAHECLCSYISGLFHISPHILDRWFESEPLKAVLATDSVIGAMLSPYMPGSR